MVPRQSVETALVRFWDGFLAFHRDTRSLLLTAHLLLFALGLDLVLVTVLRLLLVPASAILHLTAFLGGALLAAATTKELKQVVAWRVLVSLLFILVFGMVASALYDTSWDGVNYHLPAIIELTKGWSPADGDSQVRWLNLYPHGLWIPEAAAVQLTGSYEAGKTVNAVLLMVALYSLIAWLTTRHEAGLTSRDLVIAYLLIINPIVVAQLFTFYGDGNLYLLSLTLISQLFLLTARPSLAHALALSLAIVLLINAKLSGLYFAAGLCGAYAFYTLWRKSLTRQIVLVMALAGILGAGLIGYHPYVSKTLESGTVFFAPYEEIVADQVPLNLVDQPSPVKLLYAVAGRTSALYLEPAGLKIPFMLHRSEIRAMGSPDVRVGGFGPFFALEALLLCLGTLGLLMFRKTRAAFLHRSSGLLFCASACLLLGLAFPDPWWARYVPLLWAAPLFLALAWPEFATLGRVLSTILVLSLGLAALNAGLAFGGNLARTLVRNWDAYQLEQSLIAENRPVVIVPGADGWFQMTLSERFARQGIAVKIIEDYDCVDVIHYYHHVVPICY